MSAKNSNQHRKRKWMIAGSLILLVSAAAYWGRETVVEPKAKSQKLESAKSKDNRPLVELIEEEQKQKIKQGSNSESEQKPLPKPGIKFTEEKSAPEAHLIQHPELGEVIELTYSDGSKLYKLNDPVYDWSTGETKSQPIDN